MEPRGIRGNGFTKLSTMTVYADEAQALYSAFLERARVTVEVKLDFRDVSFERLVELLKSDEYANLSVMAGDAGSSSDWGQGLRELTAEELWQLRSALDAE